MDAKSFYEAASQPDAPDVMAFQLANVDADREKTFSKEGFDTITDQIHDFLVARTFGRWKLTKRGPKQLRVEVKLTWHNEPEELLEKGPPWYNLKDAAEGLTQVDGKNRIPKERDG